MVDYSGPNRLYSFEEHSKCMREPVNNGMEAELPVGAGIV